MSCHDEAHDHHVHDHNGEGSHDHDHDGPDRGLENSLYSQIDIDNVVNSQ